MKKTYLSLFMTAAIALTACSAPESTIATTDTMESSIVETTEATVNSLETINNVCSTKAVCETLSSECSVNVNDVFKNPYDVIYDYGDDYQEYVDACDWSLVFDAEYYKATFPMLALLYHNNDALLLKHFKTVGIHEGRQGCANFNVSAYAHNCSNEVYTAFGRNWAAYYIYYLMNYETERSVNTVTANNGSPVYQQMNCVYTALQLMEYDMVNQYRAAVNTADVKINSELCAFANYRAYLNSHDGYVAHDWAIANDPAINDALTAMGSTNGYYAENTVTQPTSIPQPYYERYFNSPEHYEAMVSDKYNCFGCSNLYWNASDTRGSQFDVYALDLNTVI